MAKKTPKLPIPISDRIWRGSQSWNRERIEVLASGQRLQLAVKVDAYDFQSWGRVAVWAAEGWQTIHTIPGQQLATQCSYVASTCEPSAFDVDFAELRRVALAVLESA